MWKNKKFSLTKNIFRQINSVVTYVFSKTVTFTKPLPKSIKENSHNFYCCVWRIFCHFSKEKKDSKLISRFFSLLLQRKISTNDFTNIFLHFSIIVGTEKWYLIINNHNIIIEESVAICFHEKMYWICAERAKRANSGVDFWARFWLVKRDEILHLKLMRRDETRYGWVSIWRDETVSSRRLEPKKRDEPWLVPPLTYFEQFLARISKM